MNTNNINPLIGSIINSHSKPIKEKIKPETMKEKIEKELRALNLKYISVAEMLEDENYTTYYDKLHIELHCIKYAEEILGKLLENETN